MFDTSVCPAFSLLLDIEKTTLLNIIKGEPPVTYRGAHQVSSTDQR